MAGSRPCVERAVWVRLQRNPTSARVCEGGNYKHTLSRLGLPVFLTEAEVCSQAEGAGRAEGRSVRMF